MNPVDVGDSLLGKDPEEIKRILKARKAAGAGIFDWSQITYDELRKLYVDYQLLPAAIANLYGVAARTVNDLRYKWRILESDRAFDPELLGRLRAIAAWHTAAVLKRAAEEAASYESGFKGSSGARWYVSFDGKEIVVTHQSAGFPADSWCSSSRRDAEILLSVVRKGPESDVASWLEMFDDTYPEIAAAAEDFADDLPSFLSGASLDEHETVWLAGSLRLALTLWE